MAFTSLMVFRNFYYTTLTFFSGTSNLQRSALGEIKNTRSQSTNSGQDAKGFKQPLKPNPAKWPKKKDAEVPDPDLPKDDELEDMETSSQAVDSVAQEAADIEDIDLVDVGNPQLVVEYVQDIYNYLR